MKQRYKTGIFAVFSPLLLAVACLISKQELPRVKSITKVTTAQKMKKAQDEPAALPGIQQQLARREYNISFDEQKSVMQSPNRRHGLRAYYKPGVLTVQNRIDSAGHNFSLQLVNEGIYADGKKILSAQTSAMLESRQDTLLIRHAGFTEEFINNADGVRQNFIIEAAPKATKQLQVRMSAKGLKAKDLQNNELLFYKDNRNGKRMASLVYKDIRCWDANGETLPATLAYAEGLVRLSVDVQNAAYPLTIDPIIANGNPANATAVLESNQAGAWLGSVVASAGDVNGDGYSDVLACASKFDNGQTDEGAVFVYYGSALGINAAEPTILEADQKEARFGAYASSAGDVNKDGYSDIVVGAHMYDKGQTDEGAVFVYYGSAQGISKVASLVLEANQSGASFGSVVGMAGDVNGDGYSDIVVGASLYDKGQADEGVAFIYQGSAAGLNPVAVVLEENQASSMYGYRVNGAGDVNGDGYSDILVSARLYDKGQTDEGAVFVYHGSALGITAVAARVLESNQASAYLGHSVASAGDINGDGYGDIILGASMYDNGQINEGAAFVHYGSAQGVNTVAALTLEKNQSEAQFGNSVASAGDVNGDGYADVIVGSLFYDNGQSNEGAAFIYQGSAAGLSANPASTLEGNQVAAQLGNIVASAGDVNGDGYSDVIAGVPLYDQGQADEGAAFVWMGKADGISAVAHLKLEKGNPEALFGFSVANAGDVNGDGFGDIIVGAPEFDNGQTKEGVSFLYYGSASGIASVPNLLIENNQANAGFGSSVASAGDVNGDGYSDIIVGAPDYDNGEVDEGIAFIYHGSSNGIVNSVQKKLEINHNGASMGYSVASGGDVNDDGYDDVVVGAIHYSNGENQEGAVFVYYGSSSGINNSFSHTLEGNEVVAFMGWSVSSAGDINGDGYHDIVIGAALAGNDGLVYVYHGSANGVLPMPAITLENNGQMGNSVAGVGDINGDGFDDIVVGAPFNYPEGYILGAAIVYYGSLNGITNTSSTILQGSQEYSQHGWSVSGAGDINGDGYSDILVGAPRFDNGEINEGAILIYLGSLYGIETEFTRIEGNQNASTTGYSVSTAGDINGDGYGDILVGVPNFSNGQTNEGSCFVYYGNNSNKNLQNNLRLYNSNLTTIINQSQKAKNDFGTGLYAKSFLGGGKGKLVWETKPKGQGFSKGSNNVITNSTASSGMQNTYASLGLKGSELKNVIAKQGASTKVRVRMKYDPALALTGQLYGPWRYVPAYLTGNSTAPAPENVLSDMSETIKPKAEQDSRTFNVYPNPATDKLFVETESDKEIKSIQLLTVEGKTVYQSTVSLNQVDVSGFAAGSYMLVITDKAGLKHSRKVLVTK